MAIELPQVDWDRNAKEQMVDRIAERPSLRYDRRATETSLRYWLDRVDTRLREYRVVPEWMRQRVAVLHVRLQELR